MILKTFGFFLLIKLTVCLYTSGDDVVELTSVNFERLVTDLNDIWIVEFCAKWCGHCKSLSPEYSKAATNLKGFVKVGSVDCDESDDLSEYYKIEEFPTIKIFIGKAFWPYNGELTAKAITEAGLEVAKARTRQRANQQRLRMRIPR